MRLTNQLKREILSAIMAKSFNNRRKQLKAERTELADRIWEDKYGRYRDAIALIPKDLLKSRKDFRVHVQGMDMELLVMSEERVLPPPDWSSPPLIEISPKSSAAKTLQKIVQREDELKEEERALRTEIQGILNSVTTIKRLHEVWPESAEHTKDLITSESKAMIVLPADVNKKLKKAMRAEAKVKL